MEKTIIKHKKKEQYKKALFSIDGCIDMDIVGYTSGQSWNGSGCPYFTKENALLVMKMYGEKYCYYNEELDGFVFSIYQEEKLIERLKKRSLTEKDLEHLEDNECTQFFKAMEIEVNGEKIKVYPIGYYSWCWYTIYLEDDIEKILHNENYVEEIDEYLLDINFNKYEEDDEIVYTKDNIKVVLTEQGVEIIY